MLAKIGMLCYNNGESKQRKGRAMLNYTNSSTIYLSQKEGDDRHTGTHAVADGHGGGPVRNLSRVMELLWGLRNAGMSQPITVRIMGDYFLTAPLALGINKATGRALRDVTFEGYGDTPARLIGGRRLTGFARDTFRGVSCLSLRIPEVASGAWHFTDLYVGGRRAASCRYPKEGTLRAVTTERPEPRGLADGSRWFIAHREDLADVPDVENAIVSFYHYWVDEHSPVESYDPETGKLTMAYRSRFSMTANYERNATSELYYFLENVSTAFGAPNEWYLDVKNGMLYYVPETDVDPESFEAFAPTEQQLLTVEGTHEAPVCGIRFRNLTFFCSRGDYASLPAENRADTPDPCGYASDPQAAALLYGALRFTHAANCAVEDSHLLCLGAHGIEIGKGCEGVRIERTLMEQLGGGGVKIFGRTVNEPEEDTTSHSAVRGCTVRYIGRRYAAACGILVCHSSYNDISDNEVSYTDYTGISVGWIWGYAPSTTFGNLIRRNHVHHIGVGLLSDMAGIYLLGAQSGTVVSDNYVHDVMSAHYGGHGIYTDEGSAYITVERNTVVNCRSNCYYQHYGMANVLRDNIFAFGKLGVIAYGRSEPHAGILLEDNVLISGGEPIYYSYTTPGISLLSVRSVRNRIYDATGAEPRLFNAVRDGELTPVHLAEWQTAYGLDEESTVGLPEGLSVDLEGKTVTKK